MAYIASLWPIEFDADVPIGEWRSSLPLKDFSAPWYFEPSYWDTAAASCGRPEVYLGGEIDYEFDLSRDELRALDQSFRDRAYEDWNRDDIAQMDRALDPHSPFTRFHIRIFYWESGLDW